MVWRDGLFFYLGPLSGSDRPVHAGTILVFQSHMVAVAA
jgi:hypothetical protein